ncbi:hypothetical protein Slin14017_G109320 [Septoria linicola]|nr:hypothetical protein Slin14017_G109320 [Septoria linicola]
MFMVNGLRSQVSALFIQRVTKKPFKAQPHSTHSNHPTNIFMILKSYTGKEAVVVLDFTQDPHGVELPSVYEVAKLLTSS